MVTSSERTPDENLQSLLAWVHESSDACVSAVQIETDEVTNERSLRSTRPIRQGETIVRIPPSHLITTTKAKADPLVRRILDETKSSGISNTLPDTVSDSAALLLFLLKERSKGSESFWHAWFNSLPRKFISPLTVSDELQLDDHLTSTPAHPFVTQLRAELREMYEQWFVPFVLKRYAADFCADLCGFNDSGFLYAHAVIESRTFRLNSHSDVMISPLIDMANHSFSCNARTQGWVLEGEAENGPGLELVAKQDVASVGDEICISYGNLANWELLVHFGFALEHNPFDGIVVQVEAEEVNKDEDFETNMKKLIILNVQVPEFDLGFNLSKENALPDDLVRGARILMSTEKEMEGGAKKDFGQMISAENEKIVLRWLKSIVNTVMPDVLEEEDMEDMEDGEEGRKGMQDVKKLWKFCDMYVQSVRAIVELSNVEIGKLESKMVTN